MHFEVLSTKYVNFNNFRQFFENFVIKFLFFWQFFLSFLFWETIIPSKTLFTLEVLHLSYAQRGIKKSDFKQTQLASLQVELGKANSNKASFRQIDLNLRATLIAIYSQFITLNSCTKKWKGQKDDTYLSLPVWVSTCHKYHVFGLDGSL